MSTRIVNNFFDAVVRVFNRKYPDKNIIIQFDPIMKNKKDTGYILFLEPESGLIDTLVYINAKLNMIDACDALVEQLTEVIFASKENVNKFEWKRTYNELHRLAERELKIMFKELKLDNIKFYGYDENGKEVDIDDDEDE